MSFNIIATVPFERKLKRLAKKHKSLAKDLATVFDALEQNPKMGVSIGKDCYKIRIAITSKGKGKSGGARMITFVRIIKNTIYLIDIYDKAEQATISDKDLHQLIDILQQS